MISTSKQGIYFKDGRPLSIDEGKALGLAPAEEAKKGTMAYSVLKSHNHSPSMDRLAVKFDAMASHDITYVGIIQTARASGLRAFPLPYVLTNCHNSLCAVGGTINEDDHLFGLSAAKKYGGEFVPAHMAVIHQYMRERYAKSGGMIIASDSHTRYGPYGTLSMGEGGPELVKQLLGKTYDIPYPRVVCVYLEGTPRPGVGPQDVALAIIGATFKEGIVKNSVMEFTGPGIASLSMDYRNGIDVMTTETACLSSIWSTDEVVEASLAAHHRAGDYKKLEPADGAYYDGLVRLDLSKVEPMIALPFHPSNTYTIRELSENLGDILSAVDKETARIFELKSPPVSLLSKVRDGKLYADQGVIAGCSGGTFQNLMLASGIIGGRSLGTGEYWLSAYPASQPLMLELSKNGVIADLLAAGVSVRTAFCGPCFGAGDVPANGGFSIRHTTRNFPNREGSKPDDGQLAYVALMDARSIAASSINGGAVTSALELERLPANSLDLNYHYDDTPYKSRVFSGIGKPDESAELVFGPNIADWPEQIALPENLLLSVASAIYDPVTTTDELIPSGETSSYRSNPLKLAEFTLSRKDPSYVGRAKAIHAIELLRRQSPEAAEVRDFLGGYEGLTTGIGSLVMSLRPGDGSAREQAASCQRVLGGIANLCLEYATKRYRSNVINWGMLPFTLEDIEKYNIAPGDRLYIPKVRKALEEGLESLPALLIQGDNTQDISLELKGLSAEDREIILKGSLINYYSA